MPLGVTTFPFVRFDSPATAANYSASYSQLDAFTTIVSFIAIATGFVCVGIAFILLLVTSICDLCLHRRRPRRTQQHLIFDSIHQDEIPVTVYSREDEAEVCVICLEEVEGEDVKVMPRCRHTFHGDCIDQWLGVRSATCPVCRDVIAEKERKRDDISIDIPMRELSRDGISY